MKFDQPFSRRSVLKGTSVGAATFAALLLAPQAANAIAAEPGQKKIPASHNGWPIQEQRDRVSMVWTRSVPGTALSVPICIGFPESILLHVIQRVHYDIVPLETGDLTGWVPLGRTSLQDPASNLSSGTAVRIRPGARVDAYFPFQLAVLRGILADTGGVVRWGGDDARRDESLFYLTVGPSDPGIEHAGRRLRSDGDTPGRGPGVMPDLT